MTSLVAWCGVDSRGTSSIYLASDSRISWGQASKWDYGRKLFAARLSPIILGYVGDVLFPSLALARVVDLIDSQLLFDSSDNCKSRLTKIVSVMEESFQTYPGTQRQPFSVVYCTREGLRMDSAFYLAVVNYSHERGWNTEWQTLPSNSGVIAVLGTGSDAFNKWYRAWSNAIGEDVSRSVFSAFCDSITSGGDPYSGGPPQLVGIYRDSEPAKPFGIIHKEGCYFLGLSVSKCNCNLERIEWRNELFEVCDWKTRARKSDAQVQPRPRGLQLPGSGISNARVES